jgi:hypothetical protein
MEEMLTPSIDDYVLTTDSGCTVEQVQEAECYMLLVLDYRLGWPQPLVFAQRMSKGDDCCPYTCDVVRYIMEEALLMGEGWTGIVTSSEATAAAYWLACRMKDRDACPWTSQMEYFSGYTKASLKHAVQQLFTHFKRVHKSNGVVYRRWATKNYLNISQHVAGWFRQMDNFDELWNC